MSWIQVRAELPDAEDSSPFVEIFGLHGIETTQEEGNLLSGCLTDVMGSAERAEDLAQALRLAGARNVETRPLEEQNWDEVWRQFFHPQRIGHHIVVRPTWETYDLQPDDIEIVLDPGEAFGTGDHPTTRLCLRLLEEAFADGNPARIADIGCGSGILAIAARKLGAEAVDAVDIDPTSVEVARANARLNNVDISFAVGESVANLRPPYGIVISNIISAVLIGMAPKVRPLLAPHGEWIVSGILSDNWPLVEMAATRQGFRTLERHQEDDWLAARFGISA